MGAADLDKNRQEIAAESSLHATFDGVATGR